MSLPSDPTGDDHPLLLLAGNDVPTVLNLRMNLIRALRQAGSEVAVAAPPHEAAKELAAQGIAFYPVKMRATGTRPWSDAALLWRFYRLLRRTRPAALLGFTVKPNVYGSLAARLCGVRVINNITGLGTAFISSGVLKALVTALYRPALRKSDAVFFHNEDDRRLFVEKGIATAGQARVIPGSGVDLARYKATPLPGTAAGPTFLLIGRLISEKGVREFVDAARLVTAEWPEARFQLLGDITSGPRAIGRDEVEGWIAEDAIEYLGSAPDVRPIIAQADCVVLPSYREGLPRSLLEGAAMARPLVATDAPGCRNLVEPGETGFLCEVRSAQSLAEAMSKIAGLSPGQREEMGKRARQMVEERYSDERVNEAYLAVLTTGKGAAA